MGQCMEEIGSGGRHHPTLGRLQLHHLKGQSLFKLNMVISGEEEYIQWSKKISKLRYNSEIKEYLYLPVQQEYKSAKGMCKASGHLQLILDAYDQTLQQSLVSSIKKNKYSSEYYLWRLLSTILKYLKFYTKKGQTNLCLNLDNIVLWNDGRIKMVPNNLMKGCGLTPLNEFQIEDELLKTNTQEQPTVDPLYSAGVIALCVAELRNPSQFYSASINTWKQIPEKQLRQILEKCSERYSHSLVDILKTILDSECESAKVETIYEKLEAMEFELASRKDLDSVVNLGLSMANPIKTLHDLEAKYAHEVNFLKVSNLNWQGFDKESTADPDEPIQNSHQKPITFSIL